jgi:hypothetical protein
MILLLHYVLIPKAYRFVSKRSYRYQQSKYFWLAKLLHVKSTVLTKTSLSKLLELHHKPSLLWNYVFKISRCCQSKYAKILVVAKNMTGAVDACFPI